MWLYLIIFAIPILAYFKGDAINQNKCFLALYMGGLALFVGLSDMFGGYDRYIYGSVFDSIADGITYDNPIRIISSMAMFESGYSLLCYAIAWLTENRYVYILIVTLIMYFCFYKAFARNMTNYPMSMVLFLGMVFFFTFTYLRQVLAFSVAWLSIIYLIERKRAKFLLMVLVVALLHKSGIIFGFLYILPVRKFKIREVIAILVCCMMIGFTGASGALYDAFTGISEDGSYNRYSADEGARVAYFLEVIFFAMIILSNYHKIEPTRKNIVMLNMAWCFCAMLLLFIRSSDGGRVAWFFTLGIIYIMTLLCTTDEFKHNVKTGLGTLMIAVMLLLYIRVFNAWQQYNNLYPYKTFLTDGHRSPDYSWARYEYDHNYDRNKFYRSPFRFAK